jgi:hypothetical protein
MSGIMFEISKRTEFRLILDDCLCAISIPFFTLIIFYNNHVYVQHTRFFNVLFFLSFKGSKQIGISWKNMNFMINLFLINFYILHHMGIKIQISEIGEE